jgi:hypothetical protein
VAPASAARARPCRQFRGCPGRPSDPSPFVTREPSAGPARTGNGTVEHGAAPDRSSPDGPSPQARGRSRAVQRGRPPVPGRRPGLAMAVNTQVMAMPVPRPRPGGPGAGEPGDRVSPRPRSRRDRAGRATMTAGAADPVAVRVLAAGAATSYRCRVPVSYLRVRMTCSRLALAWPSASPISCRHSRACSCRLARGETGLRAAGHHACRHLRDVRCGEHRCRSIAPGGI